MVSQAGEIDARPAISQRIKTTRERLQKQWKADHPGQPGNPFSQEEMARRIGVTLGAYGAWERHREPDLQRLREIAGALGLDEDYFSPSGDLTAATTRVEAEADRLRGLGDEFQDVLGLLRALLPEPQPAHTPDVRDVEQPQPEQDPPQR